MQILYEIRMYQKLISIRKCTITFIDGTKSKKSSSVNAVDTNIREAAVEDLKYLNLVLKDVSKLAS